MTRTCLLLALLAAAGQGRCTGIAVQPYGTLANGAAVEKVTLTNDRGMQLAYIDYGATIVAATVADRHGRRRNVILDLPDLAAYQRSTRKHAAIIGRYAGRIGGARYTLDGKTVRLQPNARGITVHGGPPGYEQRLWRRRDFADSASIGSVYTLVSPDGDQAFPGRLTVNVTYRLLRARDELRIEYEAVTDAPTVINLTNHAYFNLAGAGSAGIDTHRFQIAADRHAVTDAKRVPTGELASVAGTVLDFRQGASAAARLRAGDALLGEPAGFDHSLVFAKPVGRLAMVAAVEDTASGRRMEISTTEPSVQFYTGNAFDGGERGSAEGSMGRAYQRYDGFAFETQHLPDSPNQPAFPTTALYPGEVFRSVTTFRFTTAR
ncbi:aldose epimerase family protein [Pseudoduganella buxea]|uniref:Aldose 1-epimerase n=1 Tax=Pseudoduganella buxea TaxID=1949069 RepID=A0A6I3T400_9BURK|nr:aldose epimerase family protein [Pseudoduganella buxea]MTV55675.1 galactose-1-epimerase [Pseudoduganella buxea]GGB93608.1 aldose 1-epimerase [Pseudoduganella buxea]